MYFIQKHTESKKKEKPPPPSPNDARRRCLHLKKLHQLWGILTQLLKLRVNEFLGGSIETSGLRAVISLKFKVCTEQQLTEGSYQWSIPRMY